MPEGPVTEVFRADLDINLDPKKIADELDEAVVKVKTAVTSMQAELDKLKFPKLTFELPEKELGAFPARIKSAMEETKPAFEQVKENTRRVAEELKGMAEGVKEPIIASATATNEALFGIESRWQGVIQTGSDFLRGLRLIREEGGNVATGMSVLTNATGALIERFGGAGERTQRLIALNDKLGGTFATVGGWIRNARRAMMGHDVLLDDMARSTGELTRQLKVQADIWKQSTAIMLRATGDLGPAQKASMSDMTRNVGKLDTSLRHLTTTFLATGEISRERLQDAQEAIRGMSDAMERAKKLGIPIDPAFEARMKEAARITGELASEEQRLTAQREKGVETRKRVAAAQREANVQARQMVSVLRPGGPMATGLRSTTMMIRGGSEEMKRFSLSAGTLLTVTSGIGNTLGQLSPAFSSVITGASQMGDRFLVSISTMQAAASTGGEKIKEAMEKGASATEVAAVKAEAAAARMKATFTALGATLTAFGTAAMGVIVSTGKFAAEVETMEMTLRLVAKNAGVSVDIISAKLEELKSSGITTKDSLASLTRFLRIGLPIDELGALADAAKDVAVTLPKMASSEVMERFVWIIQSGNSALLRGIGIQKTVNQMQEEYAAKIGTTVAALTILQKQEATMQGLIKETSAFQGVYNEAMKTASKQLGSMKRYMEEIRLTIGREFLPVITQVVSIMSKFLKGIMNMKPETVRFITVIVALTAVFGTLIGTLLLMAPAIVSIKAALISLGVSVGAVAPWLVAIGLAITAVAAAFAKIPAEGEGVAALLERLNKAIKPLADTLKYFWNTVIVIRWAEIRESIENIIDAVKRFAAEHEGSIARLEMAWTIMSDLIYTITKVVDQVLAALADLLAFDFDAMWEHFASAGEHALAWLAELFLDFIPAAYDWGRNMVGQLATGLIDAAKSAIPAAAEYVGGMLSLFLEGHSPPKAGPLKKIRSWGRGVGTAYGAGIGDVNITAHLAAVGEGFSAMRGRAKDWGRNLVGTFTEGISEKAGQAIAPAMEVVGTQISKYLAGRSPPEEGRLTELQNWGKSAMEAFMAGFSMAEFGVFDQALSMIETRMKQVVGSGKENAAEMAAAMMDMRGRVAEAIAAIGAGTAVDVSNLADSIFQNVAVPITDILQVAQATLRAQAAKDAVKAIQDAATAAKDARRAAIQSVQDTIAAFQDEISALGEQKEALKKKIEEEVKARQEILGLVIDPAVLKRLEAELRKASIQVKKQEAELQKYTAYRERMGIDMLSWEEVSLMASLDLARQKQAEAQIAVDEEKDRIARVKELQDQIESQYQAEFNAIEDRIKQVQRNVKAQQRLLKQLQRADQAASRAEQARIRAAQEYAKALADDAALLTKALQERLKMEELAAKLANALGDVPVEEVKEKWQAGWSGLREDIEDWFDDTTPGPVPSKTWQDRLDDIREIVAGGPRAILGAIAGAVYTVAKDILARYGIDLDEILADVEAGWERIKKIFLDAAQEWADIIDLSSIVTRFTTFKDNILGVVRDLIEGIIEWFKELWLDLVGRSIIVDLVNDIIYQFERLTGKITDILDALKLFFDEHIAPILDPVVDAIERFWTALVDLATDPRIRQAWEELVWAFNELKEAIRPIWEALKEAEEMVVKFLLKTGGFIILGQIVGMLSSAVAWLTGLLSGAAAGMEGWKKILTGWMGIIGGIFRLLAGLLTLDWTEFGRGFDEIIQGLARVFVGQFEGIFGFITGFLEGILDYAAGMLESIGLGGLAEKIRQLSSWFGSLPETIAEKWGGLVDFFKDMWEKITGFFTSAGDDATIMTGGIGTGAISLGSIFGGLDLASIWEKLQDTWEDVKTAWGTFKTDVWDKIVTVWDNIKKAWDILKTDVWPKIVTAWGDVKKAWADFKADVWDKILKAWEDIKERWERDLVPVWEDLKTAWEDLKKSWKKLKEKVWEPLQEAWEDLKKAWKELKEKVWEPLEKAWEDLGKAVEPLIDAFGDLWDELDPLKELFNKLVIETGAWKALLIPLLPIVLALKGAFGLFIGVIEGISKAVDGIVAMLEGAVTTITGIVEVITGIVSGDKEKIEKGWQDIVDGIKGIILGFIGAVGGFFVGFAQGILEAMGLGNITEEFETLKTNLEEKFNAIKARLLAIAGEIVSGVVGKLAEIKDNATITITLLKDAAFDTVKNAIESVKNTWNWLRTWTTTTLSAGKDAAFDIVKSAVDTLKAGWTWLRTWNTTTLTAGKSAAFDIVKSAVDTLKTAWVYLRTWGSAAFSATKNALFDAVYNAIYWLKDKWKWISDNLSLGFSMTKTWLFDLVYDAIMTIYDAWKWLSENLSLAFSMSGMDVGSMVADATAALDAISEGLTASLTIPATTAALAPVTVTNSFDMHFYGPISPEEVGEAVVAASEEIDWESEIRR